MKRTLSIILLLAMLASVSCGQGAGSDDTTAANDTTESTTEATTVAETDYLDKYADVDFTGQTFTIGVSATPQLPNYAGEEQNGETINDAQFKRDSLIEEMYGVDIKYVPYEKFQHLTAQVREQLMSDDQLLDFAEGDVTNVLSTLAAEGMLRDLKEVDGLELDKPWWSQNMNREFSVNNRLFSTTGSLTFAYYYAPRIVAFNLRLADEYNVGNIYKVVDEGKWTLDHMAMTMKSVKDDLDGDGKYGEDDMWGASIDEYSAAGFYISAGGTQTALDKDGKPYFLFENERNLEIIQKVASVVGNEEYTQKAEALASRSGTYNIKDKVYTFKNGHALYLGYGAQAIALYLRDMKDDYGILPVPKLDENQENYITFTNASAPAYVGIPYNNERDELTSTILNTMGYLTQRDIQPLITEVLLKGKAARDEDSRRMIDIIYENIYVDLNTCYNFGASFDLLRNVTMGKQENFASGWASIKTKAETKMEDIYNKFAELD